ncbi:MAG: hypothetical protein V2I97_06920 [Desulfococcaceae bacterium]|jgi:hypothetical protein|nr:hypothetical protein [Desulfococcaceae bacterium]
MEAKVPREDDKRNTDGCSVSFENLFSKVLPVAGTGKGRKNETENSITVRACIIHTF